MMLHCGWICINLNGTSNPRLLIILLTKIPVRRLLEIVPAAKRATDGVLCEYKKEARTIVTILQTGSVSAPQGNKTTFTHL